MKKNILIIAIMIASCVIFCSCGKAEIVSEKNTEEKTTIEEVTTEEVKKEPQKYSVNIDYATFFSDGIAWIKFENPLNGYQQEVGLLNTEGEVITNQNLVTWNKFGSNFSNGFAYINGIKDDNGFVIIDAKGTITAQSPEDGNYEIVTGGDGIYLVHQEVKDFSTNEDRYGFIDTSGNWIVEPTVEHPFTFGENVLGGQIIPTITYRGEHIFTSEHDGYDFVTYNVDTKKVIYTNKFIEYSGDFYNGVGVIADEEKVYSLNASGEIRTLFEWNDHMDVLEYSEGVLFWESYEKGCGMLYDTNGKFLADLSKYELSRTNTVGSLYQYKNDAIAVCLIGADREEYITLLDMNGELLMDPVKFKLINANYKIEPYGNYSEGLLFVRGEESGLVLSSDGKVTSTESDFEGMDIEEIVFHDGYAWQEDIWQKGNQCFVDINGRKLVTYILEQLD